MIPQDSYRGRKQGSDHYPRTENRFTSVFTKVFKRRGVGAFAAGYGLSATRGPFVAKVGGNLNSCGFRAELGEKRSERGKKRFGICSGLKAYGVRGESGR